MRKVLYVHQDGKFTGSATSLAYLIRSLDRNLYEPWVLMAEDGPAKQVFEAAGAQVATISFARFWTAPGPRWTERAAFRQLLCFIPNPYLKEWVRRLSPDLIHINDKAAAPAGLCLRSLKIPIVQHLRSTYHSTASPINKWVSSYLIKKYAHALVAISADEADGFDPEACHLVFNSIDLDQAEQARGRRTAIRKVHGIQEDEFVVGYLGIVSPVRGIDNYLGMAARIKANTEHQLNCRFLVVGKLPEQPTAKAAFREKEVAWKGKLLFTDFQNDALGYLAAFDVLVVCNNHGVLGRPPLEALAVGTPTVAVSGHSGKSQVLKDGETGITAAKGDIAGLARNVVQLGQNPKLYSKLRENGMDFAKTHFSPQKNAEKIMAIYQMLLGANIEQKSGK